MASGVERDDQGGRGDDGQEDAEAEVFDSN
jgi:hypothetical protein